VLCTSSRRRVKLLPGAVACDLLRSALQTFTSYLCHLHVRRLLRVLLLSFALHCPGRSRDQCFVTAYLQVCCLASCKNEIK